MSVSNFLGSRAEAQQRERARREEARHIELIPEGEREEIRQIFAAKGVEGDALETVVEAITSDRERWLETMLAEERGYPPMATSPLRAALATFVAFVAMGALPLIVYLLGTAAEIDVAAPFAWSTALTALAFFLIGTLKARFVDQRWWQSGAETLALGGAAAAIAYLVGVLLQNV
jgi:VIT1/CCC1 family predicted Fe2+/Mn2+ transporter